jgi:hypothetical protein
MTKMRILTLSLSFISWYFYDLDYCVGFSPLMLIALLSFLSIFNLLYLLPLLSTPNFSSYSGTPSSFLYILSPSSSLFISFFIPSYLQTIPWSTPSSPMCENPPSNHIPSSSHIFHTKTSLSRYPMLSETFHTCDP